MLTYRPNREADDRQHYSRLFAPWPNRPAVGTTAYDEYWNALSELVDAMNDVGSRVCSDKPEVPIDAGYTYFGQFLDHELTADSTDVADAWSAEPHDIENKRSPKLDLDHLYGEGPAANPGLYEDDGVRLKIGPVVDSVLGDPGPPRRSFDVAVDQTAGTLITADRRAGDNLILRQITALFARLHNRAVKQLSSTIKDDPVRLFEEARLQTTWQFQRLVWDDYLPQVLDSSVYESVFVKRSPTVKWNRFTVPVEFSAAAMRFGHSMVRDNYFISDEMEKPLDELMARGREATELQPMWEIDWGGFFQNASSSTPISAQPIDARVASTLFNVEIPALLLYNFGRPFVRDKTPVRLPFVSLWRGAGLRLASGRVAAKALGHKPLTDAELTKDCHGKTTPQGDILRRRKLLSETPLFFYLLKEAEVRNDGNVLGPTGSQIIAETVYAAIVTDPNSFLNAGGPPPTWEFSDGKTPISTLNELFARAPEL